MTPELTTILMIASLLILMAGFPLAFGVGTVGLFFGLLTSGPGFLYMMPIRVMDGVLSEYILAAVPLFIFMAALLERSGIAKEMYSSLNVWLNRTRGGIAIVTSIMAVIMAAMSGIIGGEVVYARPAGTTD